MKQAFQDRLPVAMLQDVCKCLQSDCFWQKSPKTDRWQISLGLPQVSALHSLGETQIHVQASTI